jgi:hypothetical protein
MDIDVWVIFLKGFLMRFDGADVAFIEPMPMRDIDQDGEENTHLMTQAYQKKRDKWVDMIRQRTLTWWRPAFLITRPN